MGMITSTDAWTENSAETEKQLEGLIKKQLDEKYEKFDSKLNELKDSQQKMLIFCHFVYEIVEGINEELGTMQCKLPEFEELKKYFEESHQKDKLTKKEFQAIIRKTLGFNSLGVGQEFKDVVIYTVGIPAIVTLAKKLILGTNSPPPDEFLIPVATSTAIYYLAKSNRL